MRLLLVPLLACASASLAFASRITNLSVSSNAGTGSESLIVGFTVAGEGDKSVLIRGIGPSLAPFGVSNFAADPQLQLHSRQGLMGANDNWNGTSDMTAVFDSVGAFRLPVGSPDAAMVTSLAAGTYSTHVINASGSGVALVECYDVQPSAPARLVNVSARSFSGTGSSVLTVGFAIDGNEPQAVLIRGIGPTLASFDVGGALGSARLRLFNSDGVQIGDNSGWVRPVTPKALFDSVGAFDLPVGSADSVLFLALPPGVYSAQVSGTNGTTGNAMVEVYEVANSPVPYVTLQPINAEGLGSPNDPGAGTASPGADAQPRVLTQARPSFPFELRAASITGQVLIDFYVLSDGTVANAAAIRATDSRFATAGVNAVRQWTFVPGRRNGRLVTTHMQVPIFFTLGD